MSVTVAIRFPLGRYHATPWDRSVNEGAVEWPPSPWRLLRSLVATWYTRWPELPAPELDRLLAALGDPPAYRTPEMSRGHTRHYLPDGAHRSGETGATDLTLDPYLWLSRDDELLVHWEADLDPGQWETLAKLLELVPYIGRAESVCDARLLAQPATPDGGWWLPSPDGADPIRLLAPTLPVRRPPLEMSTVEIRKQRRTMPPETRWVTYSRAEAERRPERRPAKTPTRVEAVRFAVMGRARLMATHGVLLADETHRLVTRRLDGGRRELVGHAGAATHHRHAHWLPLPGDAGRGAMVDELLIWVQDGMTPEEVAAVVSTRLRGLSGRRGGYELKGFPAQDLLLQSAGPVDSVAGELCGRARRWHSLTPYLPVRHRKRRQSLDEYLTADVHKELSYRGVSTPVRVVRRYEEDALPDRWAREFRRYRAKETMRASRPGLGLTLEFDQPVDGPLLLGQLSHFGYGIFLSEG